MAPEEYNSSLLSHSVPEEQQRLILLEEVLDPVTRQLLTACQITEEWRCLEVGAGNGSIADWLSEKCPKGEVVASDIDTRFLLGKQTGKNFQVVRHDVREDSFPPASFDLIHTRAVLVHMPERDQVLHRMTSWMKPGGLLVIEEPYFLGHEDSPYPEFRSLMRAMEQFLRDAAGTDMRWARRLPQMIQSVDLTIESKMNSALTCGHGSTSPVDRLWSATVRQLQAGFISSGLLTCEEIDSFFDLLDLPEFIEIVFCLSSITARSPA